ncbi:MAG: GNAT family N-acetyltransferase [Methylocella sp.]
MRLPRFFGVVFDTNGPKGARFMTVNGEAAAIWRPPGHERHSFLEIMMDGWSWLAASGTAIGRALAFSAASDNNHPTEPHWYLHMAGCLPSAQRKGFGSAVVRAGLARSDADGVPAYLETAEESNLPFYASLGFAVTHEWKVKSGPACWSMLRRPQ